MWETHLLSAAAPPTNWTTVIVTAVVAFGAAGFGAYVAGRVNRSREQQQWLRNQRADIYRGALKELHDEVNDATTQQRNQAEPIPPPGKIGVLFSDLHREAVVAGAIDERKVKVFQRYWDDINNTFLQWYREPSRGEEPTNKKYRELLRPAWDDANRALKEYNDFLEHELLA
jgi:hypothetical protein